TKIEYFPNPVVINDNFNMADKKDNVLFLGRLTPVKRPWIYFELAKKFPENIFYVCGQGTEVDKIIEKYKDVKNLKFMGHVSGEKKEQLLRECKVLVNTSIHEAIPVSFLEAISYGQKLLSCQNPDDITKNNGYFTGTILGEGLDKLSEFEKGLEICFETYNKEKIAESIEKIKNKHNLTNFIKNMRELLKKEGV
ncbi:MAG: glycosyltransferase, partial [Cetobacterium sp.]|uniref:glycosyltransferase n=1 Tax=Cetobacterium sp. TaxID=2071632 RepID=UPI003EE552E3